MSQEGTYLRYSADVHEKYVAKKRHEQQYIIIDKNVYTDVPPPIIERFAENQALETPRSLPVLQIIDHPDYAEPVVVNKSFIQHGRFVCLLAGEVITKQRLKARGLVQECVRSRLK